ncbi:MAG: serine/threonine-protein kinase [Planctomycetota bacterium]
MTTRTCPKCGATIPRGRASCPRCLLELSRTPPSPEEPSDAPSEPAPSRRSPPPTPAELAADFPQFEVLELVGQGGMGCVYRARHRQLDRLVALKILAPGTEDDARFEERFLREARALARLDHPGIVRVHDFGRAGSRWFLAMEFVEGTTLRALLREGRITASVALDIVPQLCDALQYAHDEGVVHRDIKPENVLVDAQGRVKIADFGLAKLVGSAEAAGAHTRSDQVMGTPHYMAPEQATSSRDVDHRADIYSLGVVFYEMLTGELPIGRFEAPSKRAHVDARLDGIVLKSLERAPELRYQQAVEVGTDVTDLATHDANAATGPATPVRSPDEGARPRSPSTADSAPTARGTSARDGFALLGWTLAILAAWCFFWMSFGEASALFALPMISVLVLWFVRRAAAPNARSLRFGAAFLLHAFGCVAFAVHMVHRWETSTPDYETAHAWADWRALGADHARNVAAEMIAMGPAADYRVQTVSGTHAGWWPVFEQGHWSLVAVAAWLAAAGVLFARSNRWNWSELLHATLVLVGISSLTGWLAVVRVPIGTTAQRVAIVDRVDAPTTIERAARTIESFADEQRFDTRLVTEWKVVHGEPGWNSGRALQYVIEDAAPWRRWSFDMLRGPQRRTPRISVFVVETGRSDARIEVDLGALATEPEGRAAAWRALAAELVVGLTGR